MWYSTYCTCSFNFRSQSFGSPCGWDPQHSHRLLDTRTVSGNTITFRKRQSMTHVFASHWISTCKPFPSLFRNIHSNQSLLVCGQQNDQITRSSGFSSSAARSRVLKASLFALAMRFWEKKIAPTIRLPKPTFSESRQRNWQSLKSIPISVDFSGSCKGW